MPLQPTDPAIILNIAADLFAASPRHIFTRSEVVNLLRQIPDELEYMAAQKAGRIGGYRHERAEVDAGTVATVNARPIRG